MVIHVPVGAGELVDKITILAIKARVLTEPRQLANVRRQLDALEELRRRHLAPSEPLQALEAALAGVNEELWRVEDALRRHELRGDFSAEFVALARSVYQRNDERARLKRSIDALVGSAFVEEKHYAGEERGAP